MKKLIFMIFLSIPTAFAATKQKIDVIGTSSKGQFVAFEEYGYLPSTHMYFVTIRIMNVWKKEYVGEKVEIELPATRPYVLNKARTEAKEMAQAALRRYKIHE